MVKHPGSDNKEATATLVLRRDVEELLLDAAGVGEKLQPAVEESSLCQYAFLQEVMGGNNNAPYSPPLQSQYLAMAYQRAREPGGCCPLRSAFQSKKQSKPEGTKRLHLAQLGNFCFGIVSAKSLLQGSLPLPDPGPSNMVLYYFCFCAVLIEYNSCSGGIHYANYALSDEVLCQNISFIRGEITSVIYQ